MAQVLGVLIQDRSDLRNLAAVHCDCVELRLFDRPAGEAHVPACLSSRNLESDRVGDMRQAVPPHGSPQHVQVAVVTPLTKRRAVLR